MPQVCSSDSKWCDEGEKRAFLGAVKYVADSTKSNEQLLREGIGHLVGNKSSSISLIEESPNVWVACPTTPVSPGDFLGILPGHLRYQNFQAGRGAIPGPCDVWLDRSECVCPLQQMKITTSGENVNVALCWEAVNEEGGSFCDYWRVQVVARRPILQSKPLIRPDFG